MKIQYLVILLALVAQPLRAQVKVGTVGGSAPHVSAVLDIADVARGLLMPRMTTAQRISIPTPANGLMVFDRSLQHPFFYDSVLAGWQPVNPSLNTGFAVYNSVSQSISSGSAVPLSFNSEEFDHGGSFSSNSFTAPATGVYELHAAIVWNPFSAAAGYTTLEMYRNASMIRQSIRPTTTQYISVEISTVVRLVAGEAITIGAYQNSGVNQTLLGGARYARFSGARLY